MRHAACRGASPAGEGRRRPGAAAAPAAVAAAVAIRGGSELRSVRGDSHRHPVPAAVAAAAAAATPAAVPADVVVVVVRSPTLVVQPAAAQHRLEGGLQAPQVESLPGLRTGLALARLARRPAPRHVWCGHYLADDVPESRTVFASIASRPCCPRPAAT